MTSASDRRRQFSRPAPGGAGQGRFNYQQRDRGTVEQRSQSYAQGGRDNYVTSEIQTYTPQKGDNWLRVLPPTWEGAKHYGWDVHVHYGIGPDRLAYLCPAKMDRGECPICAERAALASRGMEEEAGELRPTYRIAVFIVDRKNPDKGVQLWTMPYRIDQELVALAQDKRSGEVLWIDDPYNGYDIEFTRSGEGIHTQYTGVRIARSPSPLDNDAALDFVSKHPIPEVFIFSPIEVLEKALGGQPAVKAKPGSESASAPARTETAPPARQRPSFQQPKKLSPAELVDVALRAADTHNIDIPDSVSDDDLPKFVAGKLGDHLKDYPELGIPF